MDKRLDKREVVMKIKAMKNTTRLLDEGLIKPDDTTLAGILTEAVCGKIKWYVCSECGGVRLDFEKDKNHFDPDGPCPLCDESSPLSAKYRMALDSVTVNSHMNKEHNGVVVPREKEGGLGFVAIHYRADMPNGRSVEFSHDGLEFLMTPESMYPLFDKRPTNRLLDEGPDFSYREIASLFVESGRELLSEYRKAGVCHEVV